jgi:surfeit locus 1 family protein
LHRRDYRVLEPVVPLHDSDHTPKRKVRVRWLMLLVTVLAIAGTAALGFWQLQRAATKEYISQQIDSQKKLAVIETAAQLAAANGYSASTSAADKHTYSNSSAGGHDPNVQTPLHRRVNLRGTWLHQYTVFLDNRYMAGRAGFFVATPLQIAGSPSVVWVQRGWVPRDPRERTRLPELAAPIESILVQGTVIAEVSRVYALGAVARASASASSARAPEVAGDSRIWQNLPALDLPSSTQLLPIAVLQTAAQGANAQDGLLRDWAPQDAGIAKHYGYAFQWFALCGLIIVLYAWFQFIAPRRFKA